MNIKWLHRNVWSSKFMELNTCAEHKLVNLLVHYRYTGKENRCMIWEYSFLNQCPFSLPG